MGDRGPAKQPREIAERKGTYRPSREIESIAMDPATAIPEPPENFSVFALEVWDRTIPQLVNVGILHDVGVPIIEAYCIEMGRYLEIQRDLNDADDFVITTKTGYKQVTAMYAIANKSLENAMKIAKEYGLTPSSMTKIGVGVSKIQQNNDGFLK